MDNQGRHLGPHRPQIPILDPQQRRLALLQGQETHPPPLIRGL